MFRGKKVVVVMPAYNAARTLRQTHAEVMEQEIVDEIVLVDDASDDDTIAIARTLPGMSVHVQPRNRGYGANQKNVTSSPWRRTPTSSSWFIPIISTRRN